MNVMNFHEPSVTWMIWQFPLASKTTSSPSFLNASDIGLCEAVSSVAKEQTWIFIISRGCKPVISKQAPVQRHFLTPFWARMTGKQTAKQPQRLVCKLSCLSQKLTPILKGCFFIFFFSFSGLIKFYFFYFFQSLLLNSIITCYGGKCIFATGFNHNF